MKTPRLLRRYLASAILIVVACVHVYQHRTIDRSAWGAGCGFGMFSTVEHHGTRHIRCTAKTENGLKSVVVPNELTLRARALPTKKNLTKLAQIALVQAQQQWPSTSSLTVEVWRTGFDPVEGVLELSRYDRTATVSVKTAQTPTVALDSLAERGVR